jgi:hypothetical protein
MEAWRFRHGDMDTGDMETWRQGDLDTCRHGHMTHGDTDMGNFDVIGKISNEN